MIQPTRAVGKRQRRELRVARAALGSSPRLPDFSFLGSRPPLLVALHFPPLKRPNSAKAEGARCSLSSPALPSYPPGASCLQPVKGARWAAQIQDSLPSARPRSPAPHAPVRLASVTAWARNLPPHRSPLHTSGTMSAPFLNILSCRCLGLSPSGPHLQCHLTTHCSVLGSS